MDTEIIQDTNSKVLAEKEISKNGTKYELVTKPVIKDCNMQTLMEILQNNPELISEVLSLIQAKTGNKVQVEATGGNPGYVPETSNVVFGEDVQSVGEDCQNKCNDQLVGANQSQMVLLTSKLPQNHAKQNYAMNTNSDEPSSPTREILVAVPKEHGDFGFTLEEAPSKNITTDSADFKAAPLVGLSSSPEIQPRNDPVITADSGASTDYNPQNSSTNLTLSAAEIINNSSNKSKAFPEIEEKKQICSEEYDLSSLFPSDLYSFCEIMNSPNYTFPEASCDTFENSDAQSTDHPDLLSPQYTISPKPVTMDNVTTLNLYSEIGSHISNTVVASPASSSICDDSDSESVTSSEYWDPLINLADVNLSTLGGCLQADGGSLIGSLYDGLTMEVDESPQVHCNVSVAYIPTMDNYYDTNSMKEGTSSNACFATNIATTTLQETGTPIQVESYEIAGSPKSIHSIDHDIGSPDSRVSSTYEFHRNGGSPESIASSTYEYHQHNVSNESYNPFPYNAFNIPSTGPDITAASPCSTIYSEDLTHTTQLLPELYAKLLLSNWVKNLADHVKDEPVDCEDNASSPKRQKLEVSPDATPINVPRTKPVVEDVCEWEHPVFRKDVDGDLALHIAVAQEDVTATKDILKIMNSQQLDTLNKDCQTPLHIASYIESLPIIQSLLDNGAKPEIADKDGNNVMHIACEKGSRSVIEILSQCFHEKHPLKLETMMIACNNEGVSPMHIATKKRDMDVINYLINLGCNLDVKDMKAGRTPLVYAMQEQDWELAQLFIEHGASVNVPTNCGMYPLNYVGTSSNLDLAKYLILRGAVTGLKTDFTDKNMKTLFESELRKRNRKRNRDARRE